jgi:hypothetical protein
LTGLLIAQIRMSSVVVQAEWDLPFAVVVFDVPAGFVRRAVASFATGAGKGIGVCPITWIATEMVALRSVNVALSTVSGPI